MTKATIFSLFIVILFMQWQSTAVESADTAEAKFTGAIQKTDNQFFALVKDQDVKSEWAVKPKKHITTLENENNLYSYFYTRTDPKEKFKLSFAIESCFLLQNNHEAKNFLPKEISDLVFPRQNGSCEFKDECGGIAIRASGQVHTDPKFNQGTFLPEKTPYQLEMHILHRQQAYKSDNNDSDYLFKLSFDVGGDINQK